MRPLPKQLPFLESNEPCFVKFSDNFLRSGGLRLMLLRLLMQLPVTFILSLAWSFLLCIDSMSPRFECIEFWSGCRGPLPTEFCYLSCLRSSKLIPFVLLFLLGLLRFLKLRLVGLPFEVDRKGVLFFPVAIVDVNTTLSLLFWVRISMLDFVSCIVESSRRTGMPSEVRSSTSITLFC